MLGHHDAIDIPQSTEYAKEMRKWEAQHGRFGAPGRPYVFQEYPKRLYRAEHVTGEGVKIVEAQTAEDALQERNLQSRGFYFGQDKAFEAVRAQQTEFGKLAAEREWEIQHGRLSDRAAAEVRHVEASAGAVHVPEIRRTPIKRRRRTKAEMLAATST